MKLKAGIFKIAAVLNLLFVDINSSLVHAAGGHDPRHVPENAGLGFLHFFMLVMMLAYFLKEPAKTFFRSRSYNLKRKIEESAKLKSESDQKLKQYQEELTLLPKEKEKIIQDLERQGMLEKNKIIEEAKSQAELLLKECETSIQQQILIARETLKREMIEQALNLSKARIKQAMTQEDHARLISTYLVDLEKKIA